MRNIIDSEALVAAANEPNREVHVRGQAYLDLSDHSLPSLDRSKQPSMTLIPAPRPGGRNLITIGRFSPEKNQECLLNAVPQLVRNDPLTHVYIVGSGDLERSLHKLVRELDIADHVTFTGQVANPFALLARCDCFVLPSHYEGQPMVLLEALTLGVPVVASDIPGNRSVLGSGLGLLVPPNDSARLTTAIEQVLRGDYETSPFDADAYRAEVVADFYEICGLPAATGH